MTTLDFDSNTNKEFLLYHFYLMLKSMPWEVKFEREFKDFTEEDTGKLKKLQANFKYPEPDVCPECGRKLE